MGAPGVSKVYEKLTLLNKACVGLQTRIHNALRTFAHPESRPEFLSDKNKACAKAIEELLKEFPKYPTASDIKEKKVGGPDQGLRSLNSLRRDHSCPCKRFRFGRLDAGQRVPRAALQGHRDLPGAP